MRGLGSLVMAMLVAVGFVVLLPVADGVAVAAESTPSVSPAYPIRGQQFAVTGRLSSRVSRPVQVELLVGSNWVPVASGTTSRTGSYTVKTSSALAAIKVRVVAAETRVGRKSYRRLVTGSRTVHTLSVVPSLPMVGEKFTVADVLASGPKAVRPVVAQRKVGRKWRTVATGKTDAAGAFRLDIPNAVTSMDLRVVAAKVRINGKTYSEVVSKAARVVATAQSGRLSAPATGNVDSPLTLSFSFSPPRAGRAVRLEAFLSGQWRTMGTAVTDTNGKASVQTVPAVQGMYLYRGVADWWNGAPPVTTYALPVTVGPAVTPPDPVISVTTRPQQGRLEPGGSASVPFTVTNLGTAPQALSGVAVSFANPQGVAWQPPAGCAATAYHAVASLSGGAVTLQPKASVEGVVQITMDNLPIDQNACKGVALPLHISVS